MTSMSKFTFLFIVLGLAPSLSNATPLGEHVRRDTSGSNTSIKIWLPILIVTLVVAALAMMTWFRKGLWSSLSSMGEAAAAASGIPAHRDSNARSGATGTREVTAEQLTGRAAPTPATTARRARRNRRTPSQISTRSLPAYQKDAGDQELVIYRGEDPEDVPDIAVILEDGEGVSGDGHSRNASQASNYGQLPDSPQNQSLIQGDESFDPAIDNSTGHLLPPASRHGLMRGSIDTIHSEESASSLMQAVQQAATGAEADPRGEAPPYFESIDVTEDGSARQIMPTSSSPRSTEPESPRSATVGSRPAPDAQDAQNHGSRRLSGFRSLLHTLTNPAASRHPSPAIPRESSETSATHDRLDSGLSVTSLTDQDIQRARDGIANANRPTHHPSHSGSGSVRQAFRTISRTKSHTTLNSNHLNSPSMISLNSISAPLSHTLTRTEISYPASGPTAEQMRLISSRESLGRFGRPYGAEAIAHAASLSRQDLEAPPPDFDSHISPPVISTSTTNVTRTSPLRGTRSGSNASALREVARGESPDSSGESLQEAPAVQETNREEEEGPASPFKTSPNSPVDATATPFPISGLPVTSDTLASTAAPVALRSPPSVRTAATGGPRSESRADSMMSGESFATAEESVYGSAASGTHSPEQPSTPRKDALHLLDITDTTISQGMTNVGSSSVT